MLLCSWVPATTLGGCPWSNVDVPFVAAQPVPQRNAPRQDRASLFAGIPGSSLVLWQTSDMEDFDPLTFLVSAFVMVPVVVPVTVVPENLLIVPMAATVVSVVGPKLDGIGRFRVHARWLWYSLAWMEYQSQREGEIGRAHV